MGTSDKIIYAKLKEKVDELGYRGYLVKGPANATYPFITWRKSSNDPRFTFDNTIDFVIIEINYYDNQEDCSRIIEMSEDLYDKMNGYKDDDIVCNHINNGDGPTYNQYEHFWSKKDEYLFIVGI